jgi:nitrite reductase/ring-hydroxylating ferredoxin subunit
VTWHALDVDGQIGTTPVAARLVEDPSSQVLLVRTAGGTVHATSLACPHLGQPLSRGHLNGDVIECGHHHYPYQVSDGRCVGPGGPLSGRVVVHEVREGAHGVDVRLADDAAAR